MNSNRNVQKRKKGWNYIGVHRIAAILTIKVPARSTVASSCDGLRGANALMSDMIVCGPKLFVPCRRKSARFDDSNYKTVGCPLFTLTVTVHSALTASPYFHVRTYHVCSIS